VKQYSVVSRIDTLSGKLNCQLDNNKYDGIVILE